MDDAGLMDAVESFESRFDRLGRRGLFNPAFLADVDARRRKAGAAAVLARRPKADAAATALRLIEKVRSSEALIRQAQAARAAAAADDGLRALYNREIDAARAAHDLATLAHEQARLEADAAGTRNARKRVVTARLAMARARLALERAEEMLAAHEARRAGAPCGIAPRAFIAALAGLMDLEPAELVAHDLRRDRVALRRLAIAAVALGYPSFSTPQLGRLFGGRDHSTIFHALRCLAFDDWSGRAALPAAERTPANCLAAVLRHMPPERRGKAAAPNLAALAAASPTGAQTEATAPPTGAQTEATAPPKGAQREATAPPE